MLAVAADLFEQRSFGEISVEDVARAAGVSKGLLYHYFPGKRQLYIAYIEQTAQLLLAAIIEASAAADDDADDAARLRAALGGWMHFVRARPRTYEAVVHGGAGLDDDVQRVADTVRAQIATLVSAALGEQLSKAPDPIILAGWIGFVESATIAWIAADDGSSSDAVVDASADVLRQLIDTRRI